MFLERTAMPIFWAGTLVNLTMHVRLQHCQPSAECASFKEFFIVSLQLSGSGCEDCVGIMHERTLGAADDHSLLHRRCSIEGYFRV